MTVAELGERVGRVLINPKTRVGGALALAAAGAMAVTSGTDIVTHPTPGQCAKHPLRNVYRPWRLHVVESCVTQTITVVQASRERDGDYHVTAVPGDPDLINDVNRARTKGLLLVEFVPGDPRPREFRAGMRLKITGTLVEDLQHGPAAPGCLVKDWPCDGRKRGWRELHPVFRVEEIVDPGLVPAPAAPPIPGEEPR
jgi:hypothetical protein